MPGPKRWSREELVSKLGQPTREWATITRSEVRDGAQISMADEVGMDTEGAVPFMSFACYPNHRRDLEKERQLRDEIRSLREQEAHPDLIREAAFQWPDLWGHGCVAASRIQQGEPETWVLVHVCARHMALGLVAEPLSSI